MRLDVEARVQCANMLQPSSSAAADGLVCKLIYNVSPISNYTKAKLME